jgi:hypothetical protein
MSEWSGVLALTLVVRDEAEVLGDNLDHHLAMGVDVILAVDHGSTDRTPEILSDYAERTGRVHVIRDDESRAHTQAPRVARLLTLAATDYDADWIIHGDADEFWMPRAGNLRDVFAAIPERYGYLLVPRQEFLPVADEDGPFHQRLVYRPALALNPHGHVLQPKVAQRPAAASAVTDGNHDLVDPVMPRAPELGALEILHVPMRSFAQFHQKVLRLGDGYEQDPERAPPTGRDQLLQLELERRGELPDYWRERVLTEQQIADGLAAGRLVEDRRLARMLGAGSPPVVGSPQWREYLANAWRLADLRDDALQVAERRLRELREQLEAATRRHDELVGERDQLLAAIETIRSSLLMRATAPARRLYYRVRNQ